MAERVRRYFRVVLRWGLRPPADRGAASAIARRFQIIIGRDDVAQLVLGGAIAAVGVGMMALHQHLEARFDDDLGGADLEPERLERLARGVVHGALAPARLCTGIALARAELTEHAERIGCAVGARREAIARKARLAAVATERAELPGRQVTGQRVFLVRRHRVVGHTREEIVAVIVLAHVIETETPVLPFLAAALRRAMRRKTLAPRPLAIFILRRATAVVLGLDPNAIE